MKFTAKQDIEAPISFVFQEVTDFDGWERSAMRRGAEIARTDSLRSIGPGMAWRAKFSFRSKPRSVDARLLTIVQPNKVGFAAQSAAIEATATVDLIEMSSRRTRMTTVIEVTPRTLAARLFIQSLRLARGRVDRKFALAIAKFASEVETRFRASPSA